MKYGEPDASPPGGMRLRVLVLGGAGRFGSLTARRLAASELVSEVGIAGRNQDALKRVASEIGDQARAVQVDIHDEHRLASVAADYDIVVNAAGPGYELFLPGLRGAISAGTHYCDLGDNGPTMEKQLELDAAARERDVVAVVGIGLDPGLMNLLAVHASRKFDRIEDVQICGFWLIQDWPVEEFRRTGRVDALWEAALNLVRGPLRIYRDSRLMEVDPAHNPIEVTLPVGGTVTAYPVAVPEPITLPRYLPGVRSVACVWSLFPPRVNDLFVREGARISREGLAPADAAKSFLETLLADPALWRKPPEGSPSGSMVWVAATGWKDGRRARYMCWPVRLPTSINIPLVVATLRILRGEVPERGVLPPEACFDPMPFFEDMAKYAGEEDRDKPLLGERFEWLS